MANRLLIGQRAQDSGIKIFECGMKNGYDFFHLVRYFQFIEKEKFNVIHNHTASRLLNAIKFFLPTSVLISHFHGGSLGNEKWEKSSLLFWDRFSSSLVDHYIACSNHTKKAVMEKCRLPDCRVSVLYDGIDLESFRPVKRKAAIRREFGLKDSEKIVGTVARLVPQKGIDKFIEVAKRVLMEVDNVKFLIVGNGKLRPMLEEKVIKLDLHDKVIFTGSRTDVPDLLSILDIFLLTSSWEPFGITLLEAMAVGVPIVAFAVDGVLEVVNETCTVLVSPGNIQMMSQETLNLFENKSKQKKLIQVGLERVKEFDIRKISRQFTEIYYKSLTEHGHKNKDL
jgi:glycosyltransferase involved in cell wall biosynthesis